MARRLLPTHCEGIDCPLKPVDCPFVQIGCCVPCTQGSVGTHVAESTAAHLSLVLGILTSQQRSINSLDAFAQTHSGANANVAALAAEVAALRVRVEGVEGRHAALEKAHLASEAETRKLIAKEKAAVAAAAVKEVKRVEEGVSKLSKARQAERQDHVAETQAVRQQLEALQRRVADAS